MTGSPLFRRHVQAISEDREMSCRIVTLHLSLSIRCQQNFDKAFAVMRNDSDFCALHALQTHIPYPSLLRSASLFTLLDTQWLSVRLPAASVRCCAMPGLLSPNPT